MKSHFKMQNFTNFFGNACKICKKFDENLLKFCEWSGAKACQSNRSRQELSNESFIPTSTYLQKSASIQPRTSPVEFADPKKCANRVEHGKCCRMKIANIGFDTAENGVPKIHPPPYQNRPGDEGVLGHLDHTDDAEDRKLGWQ